MMKILEVIGILVLFQVIMLLGVYIRTPTRVKLNSPEFKRNVLFGAIVGLVFGIIGAIKIL